MAVNAVVAEHGAASRLDQDGLMKVLERERLRVHKAVFRFGRVFADKIVRNMAIIARRHAVMAGFLPTVVLLAHDMAIDASFRVVAQVGSPLGIVEGIGPHAEDYADEGAEHCCGQ